MERSDCCGAETMRVIGTDYPHVYDDDYKFEIDLIVCTFCGKVLGLGIDPE